MNVNIRKVGVDSKAYPIFYKWLQANNFNVKGIYVGNNHKYRNIEGGYENDIFSIIPSDCDNSFVLVYKPLKDKGVIKISPIREYADIDCEEIKEILEECSESMKIDYSDKHEFIPYIKGENDKKLYIVNLYGDKLVITDNVNEAISFMDSEPINELADKLDMDINIYIHELPMRVKYFRFSAVGFEMILKVYYHKNLDIDLEYIKENVTGRYISMLATAEEIDNYTGTHVDAYITINNKGEITDY